MKCSQCGTENASGLVFCQECGQALSQADGEETCAKCGHANLGGVLFCEDCGARLQQAVSAPAQVKCANCGRVNRPGVQFCEECGAHLKDAASFSASSRKPMRSRIKLGRVGAVLLAAAAVAALLVVVVDRLRFPVTRGQARDMAVSAIQVSYPELSGIAPKVTEYIDEAGSKLVLYSYVKQVDGQVAGRDAAELTHGAHVKVNRKTGKIEVIAIR